MPPADDLHLHDFDFELPPDLIAQHPLADRAASRLLDVSGTDPAGQPLIDRAFADLPDQMAPGDLLVCNDTRVIKARLLGRKATGGRAELLVERIVAPDRAWALVRTSHPPAPGTRLLFEAEGIAPVTVTVLGRHDGLFEVAFDADVATTLEAIGRLPLPPYIRHVPDAEDAARYQTVYAAHPGAVAAPTAGLHFTPDLLAALEARGVQRAALTLHVGAGTFQPVRTERLADHRMHAERYDISAATAAAVAAARARGGRVWAVGTTTLRALESAARADGSVTAGDAETSIFIRPGFRFRVVDRLITNFHLPRSTLLMLVAAFAGLPRIRAAYAHAVAARYRFFSYGDAMLLARADEAA